MLREKYTYPISRGLEWMTNGNFETCNDFFLALTIPFDKQDK